MFVKPGSPSFPVDAAEIVIELAFDHGGRGVRRIALAVCHALLRQVLRHVEPDALKRHADLVSQRLGRRALMGRCLHARHQLAAFSAFRLCSLTFLIKKKFDATFDCSKNSDWKKPVTTRKPIMIGAGVPGE